MALPTSYTESELAAYMETVLGDTAHKLGWRADNGDFDEPVNEVLLLLEEADLTFVNTQAEVAKVRCVARQEAWRAAMFYSVHETSHSAGAPGTGQTSRADVFRQAKQMFELAKAEVYEKYPSLGETTAMAAGSYVITYAGDYYANQADTDEEYV